MVIVIHLVVTLEVWKSDLSLIDRVETPTKPWKSSLVGFYQNILICFASEELIGGNSGNTRISRIINDWFVSN